jgi:hypothetical protein
MGLDIFLVPFWALTEQGRFISKFRKKNTEIFFSIISFGFVNNNNNKL